MTQEEFRQKIESIEHAEGIRHVLWVIFLMREGRRMGRLEAHREVAQKFCITKNTIDRQVREIFDPPSIDTFDNKMGNWNSEGKEKIWDCLKKHHPRKPTGKGWGEHLRRATYNANVDIIDHIFNRLR